MGANTVKDDASLGIGLGLLLAGVSIAGNVLRGDPHLVSTFPHLAGLFIIPAGVFVLLRWRRSAGADPGQLWRSGSVVVLSSATVSALLVATFTAFWFSPPSRWPLTVFSLVGTFAFTWIFGYAAALVSVKVLGPKV